jgi:hypothetical protein
MLDDQCEVDAVAYRHLVYVDRGLYRWRRLCRRRSYDTASQRREHQRRDDGE